MQSSSNAASVEGETGTVAAGLAVPRSDPPETDAPEARPSEPPELAEPPAASSSKPAKSPASRPQPPAIPAFLQRGSRPPASAPAPARRDAELDLSLGAPLLPERAHDPHYYPGISDEPPAPTPLAPPAPAWRVPSLAQLPRIQGVTRVAVAGGVLLLLGLVARVLFGGAPSSGALVVDVTPSDAHVTLDGEPLPEISGLRKRGGLMNGEHVLAADKRGFVSQQRAFTFDARGGDLRIMLTLPAEPAPVSQPMAAAAEPQAPAPQPPAAEPAIAVATSGVPDRSERSSARELARQRRLERLQARKEARAARRAEARAAGSGAPAVKSGVPAATSATRAAKGGAPALLKLNSVPWAEVYVDKRHVGHTPIMGLQLPPGKHVIRLTNPSLGGSKTLRLKLSAGETVAQVVKL